MFYRNVSKCLYWSISAKTILLSLNLKYKAGMFQQGQFIIIRKVGEKMDKCHELSAMDYWISQKIIFKFKGNGFGRYAKGVPCSYEFKR